TATAMAVTCPLDLGEWFAPAAAGQFVRTSPTGPSPPTRPLDPTRIVRPSRATARPGAAGRSRLSCDPGLAPNFLSWGCRSNRCGRRHGLPDSREQGRSDSNAQPLVLETSALPIELHPFEALSCQHVSYQPKRERPSPRRGHRAAPLSPFPDGRRSYS